MKYQGILFEKNSSQSHKLEVELSNETLNLYLSSGVKSFPKEEVEIETPMNGVPVVIKLDNGTRIEIPYSTTFVQRLKKEKFLKNSIPFKLESSLKFFLLSFVVFALVTVFIFKVLIPSSSQAIAELIPNTWGKKLDQIILSQLDDSILSETELSVETRDKLNQIFKEHGLAKYNILYRKGGKLKANAFALSTDTIVFTDELVKHINQGKLLLSIALHEAGHIKEKHLLKQLITDAGLTVFSLFLFGDLAGGAESIAQLGLILTTRSFSQRHELEADEYEVRQLEKFNFSPLCAVMALEKISEYYKAYEEEDSILKYLSTHPQTSERIERIKELNKNHKECLIN